MLLVRTFYSPWLYVGWAALFGGFLVADKSLGPRPVFYGLVAVLAFHALAIPGSLLWGSGNWIITT